MGSEFYCIKGCNHYLVDAKANEGYCFTAYGNQVEPVLATYVLSICRVRVDVDILSILSDVTCGICEIYFKGKKAVVKERGLMVYKKCLQSIPRASAVAYRIIRPDCMGVTQMLLPLREGVVSFEDISKLFGNLKWESL